MDSPFVFLVHRLLDHAVVFAYQPMTDVSLLVGPAQEIQEAELDMSLGIVFSSFDFIPQLCPSIFENYALEKYSSIHMLVCSEVSERVSR